MNKIAKITGLTPCKVATFLCSFYHLNDLHGDIVNLSQLWAISQTDRIIELRHGKNCDQFPQKLKSLNKISFLTKVKSVSDIEIIIENCYKERDLNPYELTEQRMEDIRKRIKEPDETIASKTGIKVKIISWNR